jgi:magnesium transporter
MLTVYDSADGVLVKRDVAAGIGVHPVWIDLLNPTRDEDLAVEQALGVKIPTREEMEEIEASSRVYQEGGAHYMTAVILHQAKLEGETDGTQTRFSRRVDTTLPPVPQATAVTFVLAKNSLITVRYDTPRAFELFLARNQKGDNPCTTGCALFVGLLEAVIDREADRVERVQAQVDHLGHNIFNIQHGRRKVAVSSAAKDPAHEGSVPRDQRARNRSFERALRHIGREGEMTSRSRESLQSLDRILTYLAFVMGERNDDKHLRARVKTASRDVGGLNDQVHYMSGKIQFLLDATLGMIGLEQNNIIKFFTVVSVALMPPTLIASIYGMNFKQMPELEWAWGYPMAIVLMTISAVIPFLWFRRKGWL